MVSVSEPFAKKLTHLFTIVKLAIVSKHVMDFKNTYFKVKFNQVDSILYWWGDC